MRPVNPDSLPSPHGYNNGMLAIGGKILFIAGQIGWDKEERVAEGLVAQFDLALRNVLEVLREAGGRPHNIGRFTIFVKDKRNYLDLRKAIGTAYRRRMGKHFPAMSLVEVKDLLEENALVEIEATAVLP